MAAISENVTSTEVSLSMPLTDLQDGGTDGISEQNFGEQKSDEEDVTIEDLKVLYSYRLSDYAGRYITTYKSDRPSELEVTKEISNSTPQKVSNLVFEVHIEVKGREASDDDDVDGPRFSKPIEDIEISEIGLAKIIIHSQPLLNAIRSVVTYYPGQNLAGDSVTIHEPYAVLIHHLHELKELQLAHQTSNQSEPTETLRDKNADEKKEVLSHLQLLFDFLGPFIEKRVTPEEKRYKKQIPAATFQELWLLYKPGSLAYCISEGELDGVVIISVDGTNPDKAFKGGFQSLWKIRFWCLETNGEVVSRSATTHSVRYFEGEKPITSLLFCPVEFWDAMDGGERRKKIEARGEKYFKLLERGFRQVMYDGYIPNLAEDHSLGNKRGGSERQIDRKKLYCGPVIVDAASAIAFGDWANNQWTFTINNCNDKDAFQDRYSTLASEVSFKWAAFENVKIKDHQPLTRIHFFLASAMMPAFALKDKNWNFFGVDSFLDDIQDDRVQKPILADGDLEVIKALSYRQTNMGKAWKADFIQDKGEGQIVLLHGPPGVGKTYTVEWIALTTKRPLLSLTIADIGTQEQNMESELAKWFNFAEMWNAILLIDEADIFLERRHHYDLARNGIVSVFLRKMEYFRGLLFLTTNRIGHIDDAFLSRVHVVIEYKKLDDDTRHRIWEAFFEKLKREKKGAITVHPKAKKFVLEGAEMKNVPWNGREIRNAFQTAIALAEYEASNDSDYEEGDPVTVVSEHFQRVMQMSKAFRLYMDSIQNQSESKRAQQNKDRNDEFEQQTYETKLTALGGENARKRSAF